MDVFVLKNKKTGKWVALDSASGGYPYDVDDIHRAQKFYNVDEAERYIAVNSSKNYDKPVFTLHRMIVVTEQVRQRTGAELEALRYRS